MTIEAGLKRVLTTNRITLRLPNNILQLLKSEADRKDIPLNALVAKILTKSIAIDRSINVMPNISIPWLLFSKILDSLDNSSLEELAKESPNLVRKSFMIQGIRYDFKEVVDSHFMMIGKHCGWYRFTYDAKGDDYRLVFESGSSSRWTRFLEVYIRSILESLRLHIESSSTTDNVIVFEVRNPSSM